MKGKDIDKQLLESLDFRNASLLTQFISDTGKILPRLKDWPLREGAQENGEAGEDFKDDGCYPFYRASFSTRCQAKE